MSWLSLIRFGTYALLIFAALFARRQHYVIPVHFSHIPEENDEPVSRSISVSRNGLLGFGDTVLSGSTVLKLAEERTKAEGISVQELAVPTIELEVTSGRLRWRVTREVKRSLGDGTIWVTVFVDDKTSETKLERYKHPEPQRR